MIQLFNINTHTIDTAQFSNLLHDKIVTQFEEAIAEYVGAKYAVSFSSATAAIFLSFIQSPGIIVSVPSILPPVVANAIISAGCNISFADDIAWVGGSYILHPFAGYTIIDSAHKLNRDQFKNEARPNDLMIFSFYPTKVLGGCDGGMIVSDDKDKIERLRLLSMNGIREDGRQTMIGHKMYLNSIQASIAMENFKLLEEKKRALFKLRTFYNNAFSLNNTSEHLYRIKVADNMAFVRAMKEECIICGVHYKALHTNPIFGGGNITLPRSERAGVTSVSIPFNETISENTAELIVQMCFKHKNVES